MRIDSSGNVGIGVTTIDTALSTKLHVAGTIRTDTGAAAANPAIVFDHDNFADADANYIMLDRTSEAMRFSVNASERMRIDSSGNVGIGTSSPSTPLTVAGKGTFSGAGSFEALELITSDTNRVYVTGNSSVSGDMWRLGTSASNPNLNIDALQSNGEILFRTGGTNERMRIDAGGNVGIGISSPSYLLSVENSSTAADYYASRLLSVANPSGTSKTHLRLEKGDGYGGTIAGYLEQGVGSGLSLQTINGGTVTERMRITSAGNVGIGISSPRAPLHVQPAGGASDNFNVLVSQFRPNIVLEDLSSSATDFQIFVDSNAFQIRSGDASTDTKLASELMRIDSSGNVGIGTSSPAANLHVNSASNAVLSVTGNSAAFLRTKDTGGSVDEKHWDLLNDNGNVIWRLVNDADNAVSSIYNVVRTGNSVTRQQWYVGTNSEAMRIDSSGNVLVGMTAASSTLANIGVQLYPDGALLATRSGNPVLNLNRKTSDGTIVDFKKDGNEEGTISISGGQGVSYNTTSDYRLKENVTEVTGAANRVKALNPVRFNFIAAPDKIVDGFLAHEVSDIVPEAIHGEKDAVDADGNPKYQGIDQSKLVPLLTAALQEALTKIDELEARVAALETA
jgi:hypothetical protein